MLSRSTKYSVLAGQSDVLTQCMKASEALLCIFSECCKYCAGLWSACVVRPVPDTQDTDSGMHARRALRHPGLGS